MGIYRVAWAIVAVSVGGVAMAFDVAEGGALRVVALTAMVASFAATLAFALAEESRRRWWWTWQTFLWSGLVMAGIDALVRMWGGIGFAMSVLLGLTAPAVIEVGRTQWFAWTSRHATGPPESMDRRELIRRWEWTTALLQRRGASVADVHALVEERRRLLDEIERRDAAAYVMWLPTAVPDRRPPRSRVRPR